MSDRGKSNCIRICHSHTDWLRVSTRNLRTVPIHSRKCSQIEIIRHIDPSCNTHAVRCYKTDYRVDPVNALTQLTTLGRYIVFRVHRCHVVRYPVARKQTADIDGLVILIIFCIRIGLIKIITAIGESSRLMQIVFLCIWIWDGTLSRILIRKAVHCYIQLGCTVCEAQLLIVIKFFTDIFPSFIIGYMGNTFHTGRMHMQFYLICDDSGQLQRISFYRWAAL